MSEKSSILENFAVEVAVVLRETETSLNRLSQAAFANCEKLRAAQNKQSPPDDHEQKILRFQQLGQQLSKLSQWSSALQNYLQNSLDAPPLNNDYWPRIKILRSQEEERTQIARELEDNIGQLLANAVFELASCRHLLANETDPVSEGLDALQQELEQGLADIRHVITDLEPAAILGNFGLGGGVRRYLEKFETRTNLITQLRIKTNIGRLPSIIEVAIFRVIQEALHNVHRHANASQVDVLIEEKGSMLEFSVVDNGDGIISDRVDVSKKNFGLARMVDYADLLGGQLRIFSEPGHGTQVLLSIPYNALQ